MKIHDSLAGLLLLLLGIAVIAVAQTFPALPGQNFGAAVFPTVAGAGLVLFSVCLIVSALRQRRGEPWFVIDDWMRRPRMVGNGALVIAALIFYALAVDAIGFFLTGIVFLSVLFYAFDVKRLWILPLACTVTFGIHYGFYTLLHVPLPWGVFEAFAW